MARWNSKPMPEVELKMPEEIENEKSDVRDLFYDVNVAKITLASWISWYVDFEYLHYVNKTLF